MVEYSIVWKVIFTTFEAMLFWRRKTLRQRKILKKIQKYFDTAPKLEKIFYKCMIILPVDFSIKLLYTVYYIDYFKYLVGVRVMEGFQQAVAENKTETLDYPGMVKI